MEYSFAEKTYNSLTSYAIYSVQESNPVVTDSMDTFEWRYFTSMTQTPSKLVHNLNPLKGNYSISSFMAPGLYLLRVFEVAPFSATNFSDFFFNVSSYVTCFPSYLKCTSSSTCLNGGKCNIATGDCVCPDGLVSWDCAHGCLNAMHIEADVPGTISSDLANGMMYTNNANCSWKVTVPAAYELAIEFTTFDLDVNDVISFYDANGILLYSFTNGQQPPKLLAINQEQFTVHFESDSWSTRQGFSLYYVPISTDEDSLGTQLILPLVLGFGVVVVLLIFGFIIAKHWGPRWRSHYDL